MSPNLPPLFCGDKSPYHEHAICTLDAFHPGPHSDGPGNSTGTIHHWDRTPTEPSIRAARVIPDTIPKMKIEDRSCYFCGEQALYTVSVDVPTCGMHGKK